MPVTSTETPTLRFAWPASAALGATAAVVAGLLAWATISVDGASKVRQERMVAAVVHQSIEKIARDQEGVTIWDEAVRKVNQGTDLGWLDSNLGVWMYAYLQHDRVYILAGDDRPVYAMVDGVRAPAPDYGKVAAAVAPLVRDLRDKLRASPRPASEAYDLTAAYAGAAKPSVTPGAVDLMSIEGRPAIVSLKPIVSDTGSIAQTKGQEAVHISMRYLDGTFTTRLGDSYLLENAHFRGERHDLPDELSYALTSNDGTPIGYIDWKPFLPGSQVLSSTIAAFVISVCAIGGIFLVLLSRLRRGAVALKESEAQAQHLALHDTLTGLPNRAQFEARLDTLLAALPEQSRQLGLIYLDIDRFKQVNDTLGHPAGDALICEIGRRLKDQLRGTDVVARLGGDEFAILVTAIKAEADVMMLCRRLEAAIKVPVVLAGSQTFPSVSIGVAIAPGHGQERGDLSRKADIALYDAKTQGRGRTVVFQDEMEWALQERRAVERDLREALKEADQLFLVYQPLVSTGDATMIGVEALVRWNHPEKGLMSPAMFVPVAEETGLIEPLGEWVMRKACVAALAWPHLVLSVNVSAVQIRNPDFGRRTLATLHSVGFDPRRLQIEITETALLDNLEEVRPIVATLRAAGVSVALDDFGTGYSSLSHLRQFDLDRVKIDRSFVNGLGKGSGSEAIVQAIVDLAHGTGVKITAEGVETEEQRDYLIGSGCDELQGYLLGRPMKAADIDSLVGVRRLGEARGSSAAA